MLRYFQALTICQPHAHFIFADEAELAAAGTVRKLVENRRWPTTIRGPIAIHAGLSRSWLEDGDAERFPEMVFGAVVGLADLVTCVR